MTGMQTTPVGRRKNSRIRSPLTALGWAAVASSTFIVAALATAIHLALGAPHP